MIRRDDLSIVRRFASFWPIIMIGLIGYLLMSAYMYDEYNGDDLMYLSGFHGLNGTEWGYYDAVRDFFPRWTARHWVYVNGRSANVALVFNTLWMPHTVNAIFAALAHVAFFALAAMTAFPRRRGSVTGRMLVIGCLAFAMPWWDSFTTYAVVYNYVWASAMVLLIAYFFAIRPKLLRALPQWVWWLLLPVAVIAGAAHEAASVPLAIAAVIWLWYTRRLHSLGRRRAVLGICFCAGALICLAAPGIWSRLGSGRVADDPVWMILLKSDFMVGIMLAVIGLAALSRSGRSRLASAARTPWLIFTLAACGSAVFSGVSGIVGRSGWFASLYALISLFMLARQSGWKISRPAGAIVAAAISCALYFHYVEVARWQVRFWQDVDRVRALYAESEDGTVYYDATYEDRAPWWLLGRLRGVPDADDTYQLLCFDTYYSDNRKRLRIVPQDARTLTPSQLRGQNLLENGDYIVPRIPAGAKTMDRGNGRTLTVFTKAGREWTATPLRLHGQDVYLLSPRIIDPGDR